MQGHWINQANYYRCRFPAEYALASKITHPGHVYLREDAFDTRVNNWLAGLFAPSRLHQTIEQLMAAQDTQPSDAAAEAATAKVADANQRMARYKAAIDAGGDPAEIGAWITKAKAQRLSAEAQLRHVTTKSRLTRQEITDLITEVGDIAATLRAAEPGTTADAYKKLGLRLTYHPDRQVVCAAAKPQPDNIGKWLVSEGRLHRNLNAC
jgi:site-specific DNA recombinase